MRFVGLKSTEVTQSCHCRAGCVDALGEVFVSCPDLALQKLFWDARTLWTESLSWINATKLSFCRMKVVKWGDSSMDLLYGCASLSIFQTSNQWFLFAVSASFLAHQLRTSKSITAFRQGYHHCPLSPSLALHPYKTSQSVFTVGLYKDQHCQGVIATVLS